MTLGEATEMLREAAKMMRCVYRTHEGGDCACGACKLSRRILDALTDGAADHNKAYDDLRVLRSNCEHSNNGQFRVHLTEHDFMLLTGEVALLRTELAERQVAATTVVEPVVPPALHETESDGFWREETYRNNVHKCAVLIQRDGVESWYWSVGRAFDGANVGRGFAPTLDEAKVAAIAAATAAGGMR